jgi:ABC-type phosphate transport system substrate-binding protein
MKRLLVAILLPLLEAGVASAGGFKEISSRDVSGTAIPKQVLTDVFLRKVTRWGNGQPIRPVDLSLTSPVRGSFSSEVLGIAPGAVASFWMKRIASGEAVPPPAKRTDGEVIEFVATHTGAVGYVAESTAVPDSVKVIEVR